MADLDYQNPPPPNPPNPPRKPATQPPQDTIASYWRTFKSPYPGKIFSVLPPHDSTTSTSTSPSSSSSSARRRAKHQHAHHRLPRLPKTYAQAHAECARDVDRIIRECRRTNQKYRDPHFDIEWDLKTHTRDCLDGLNVSFDGMQPKGVKRVTDIFENPQFYINGPTAGDVRQGRDGDCYLMAALCGLGSMEGLIKRVVVKYDQEVGVYGFVFWRDGEWQQTIVDDKLYLRAPDYEEALEERDVWEQIDRLNSEEEYRKAHQTGSRALYFAQCAEENETWLPLLEKAYAKAHGDYAVIDGGWVGEAVEDLTGGVTTEIYSSDIYDKDRFWEEELKHVGKTFLFGCATGFYSDWLEQIDRAKNPNNPNAGLRNTDRRGVVENHAYSIMDAREIKGERLLKVRNPWGKKEWTGKWSDGSEQWDSEWMKLLDHKFGNDGIFWISYDDLLRRYQHFDRTRIFNDEWTVKQCWTTVDVGWEPEYHQTKFELNLSEQTTVVIVLSQLDSNYWKGLQGEYNFDLQFRLEKAGSTEGEYIVRSNGRYAMERSVSTDLELAPGKYFVLMKIEATQNGNAPIEEVLHKYVKDRRDKLIQIGTSYDLAHAKGMYVQSKAEKKERRNAQKEKEKLEKHEAREELKKSMKKEAFKAWEKQKKRHDREKTRAKKREAIEKAREAQEKARQAKRDRAVGNKGDSPEAEATQNGATPPVSLADVKTEQDCAGTTKEPGTDAATAPEAEAAKSAEPLQIKSFSGEDVPTPGTVTPAESLPSAPPPTRVMTKTEEPMADASQVLQPLDKILESLPTESTTSEGQEGPQDGDTVVEERPPTPIVQINGQDAITDVKPLPTQPTVESEEHASPTETPNGNAEKTDRLPTSSPETASAEQPSKPDANTAGHQSSTVNGDDDDTASIDSFESFDWDSELDVPSETSSSESESDENNEDFLDSDSDSDSDSSTTSAFSGAAIYRPPTPIKPFVPASVLRRRRRRRSSGLRGDGPPDGSGQANAGTSENGDGAGTGKGEQLWNAVCTVGLRVYSKLADEKVGLKVVWPEHEEEERLKSKRRGSWGKKKKEGKVVEDVKKIDPDDMNRGAVVLRGGRK